jgi:hypothetical protein
VNNLHVMANFFYKSLHLFLPYTIDWCIKMTMWIILVVHNHIFGLLALHITKNDVAFR